MTKIDYIAHAVSLDGTTYSAHCVARASASPLSALWLYSWSDAGDLLSEIPAARRAQLPFTLPLDADLLTEAVTREDSPVHGGTVTSGYPSTFNMSVARAVALERIKRERDATIFGGFTWDGSTFDSDETAQARLLGMFVDSQQPGYQGDVWRLADNSWRILSAADATAVWGALKHHIRSAFQAFAQLEAQILAAQTPEEIETVEWPL